MKFSKRTEWNPFKKYFVDIYNFHSKIRAVNRYLSHKNAEYMCVCVCVKSWNGQFAQNSTVNAKLTGI